MTGRKPTRTPSPGDRVHVGFRATFETKARLVEAAAKSGRSLSQEAEYRLQRSFEADEVIARLDRIERSLAA